MNLRQRTLLAVAATLAGLMAGAYLISSSVILRNYEDLERAETALSVARVNDELDYQLREMHANSSDWSNWDDTYQFMHDRHSRYLGSNYTPVTFANLDLRTVILLDMSGRIVYIGSWHRDGKRTELT